MTDAARRSDPTRVLARRTFAWIVDVLLFEAAFLAAIVAFGQRFTGTAIALEPAGFRFEGGDATLWFPKDVPSLGDSVLVVPGDKFWLAVGIFWFVLLLDWVIVQGLTGRTLGKSIVGIRCVTRDRHRPGIGRALLRTILWLIDIIMIVLPIGFILATFTKGHRRVGDFGGGTFVVKKEFAARLAGGREEDTGPERIPASEVQLAGTGEDEAADYEAYAPEDGTPQSVFEPPPEPEPQPEPTPAPAAAAASDAPGATAPRERSLEPVWNDALDTYVRWEPSVERWIGWDEAAQKWRLVDPSRLG